MHERKSSIKFTHRGGAKSVHLCHLANISYRVKKPMEVDNKNGRIYDREAMKLWRREYKPGWEPTMDISMM